MEACDYLLDVAHQACDQGNNKGCELAFRLRRIISMSGRNGASGFETFGRQSPGRDSFDRQSPGGGFADYDPEEQLPCRFMAGSTSMISGNLALVPCARLIAASGGRGMWGDNDIEVDENSTVYVNGEEFGVARNESGTVGTLSQRCARGDTAACQQWYNNSQNAIDQMDRLYGR